ncbi:hypothetical protein OG241_24900 [Streptomyces sp. NBC_01390]|uniref:hypothetical protein n=1 Tax=Streptomyces sp. NBC_01390 TaxID=2903850 RepID=UPI003248EC55
MATVYRPIRSGVPVIFCSALLTHAHTPSQGPGRLSSVVAHGLGHGLSWLDSAHHEFEALVKEKLGAEAAESIDWRNPRMVCIAASFSHHDRVAVHRLHERIDLEDC